MSFPPAAASILLVEDEAVLALDLAELLEGEGYRVAGCAATGPEALALLRAQPADLLLCDIRIQGPWDGIETARRLLAERPGLPLIYLTALADRATLDAALGTAPAAYLTKPVSVPALRAALAVALRPAAGPPPAHPAPEPGTREPILRLGDHLFVKHNYQFVRLALADIVLLEADNTTTTLHTAGPHYALRLSLSGALARLAHPGLVRVHRSYALNLAHVTAFTEYEATVGRHMVPLGRQYKADFLRQFRAQ